MGVLALSLGSIACGALRQNLRNQFVSYRGAWECKDDGCSLGQMVRSTKSHREGNITVNHVAFRPEAALVFYPGTPVKTLTANVECGGATAPVPAEKVKAPGSHRLPGEGESWVVVIDRRDYDFPKGCKRYMVTTHATWDDGSKYDERGGIEAR